MNKKRYKKKNNRLKKVKTKLKDKFTLTINKMADAMPDFLVGSKEVMKQKYSSVYGITRSDQLIIEARRRTGKLYLILIAVVLLLAVTSIVKVFSGSDMAIDLKRSPYEGESKTVTTEIEAEYNGETQKRNAEIVIQPKGLTEKEKEERIEKTKENLPTLIIGDNYNLNSLTSNLDLVTIDPETGVEISWKSSNEELVSDEGEVNSLVAKEKETVILDAQFRIDETTDALKLSVGFGVPKTGKELESAINASVNNVVTSLGENNSGNKLTLPSKTPEGVSLKWKTADTTGMVTQIALLVLVGVCIYYSRYSFLNKRIKETKESVARDFPDFINKLVLLLNAGMVVTAAFSKITLDYRNRSNKGEKKHLYEEFCTMEDNINNANSGFLEELNDIAQRSGIRDVMRFNTIIVDNIDKGSALVEKLQSESQILWTGRIKMAEEKGRLAETKLTFPMVLQLLVLIIITIAPAAMEM